MWITIKNFIKHYIWRNLTFLVGLILVLCLASFLALFRQHNKAFNLMDTFLEKFFNWFPKRDVPIGTPDDKGFSEQKVEELDISNNIFRDKTTITSNDQNINLPSGLQDKNVDTLIQSHIETSIVSSNPDVATQTKATIEQAQIAADAAKTLLDSIKK